MLAKNFLLVMNLEVNCIFNFTPNKIKTMYRIVVKYCTFINDNACVVIKDGVIFMIEDYKF